MKMPSVMKHTFSEVPEANIERSSFNRDHGYKTTFNAGYLVPFLVDEVLPGDSYKVNATLFARLATPIVPVMDNMFLETFYFFVPLRLVWDNFQAFMGEQDNPDDSTDFLVPIQTAPATTGYVVGELADYFGLPTGVPGIEVNSLPFRAYNLIWNQWFRDQNLQDSVVVDKDDGADTPADYVLLKRGKRHDYFTSALPWAQKSTNPVELPLSGNAPITGIGVAGQTYAFGAKDVYETGKATTVNYANTEGMWSANAVYVQESPTLDGTPNIYADLSAIGATTINELRQAFQLQKLLERDARGGTRYVEILRAHFNVISPDFRLQRPEFLGGASTPVLVTPVPQTSGSPGTGGYTETPQGNLAGFGTVTSMREGFTKSFVEHGYIIGLMCVRADLTYQQGVDRMWSRRTKYDFYWPALAHLGEQAVLNKEIYAQAVATPGDANDLANQAVFGYQERFAEYRYKQSRITGQLRSTFATPLDMWHLSQEFTDLPVLSDVFIEENPPMERILAVTTEPHFIMDSYIRMTTVRPMPVYSVPGLIDHF